MHKKKTGWYIFFLTKNTLECRYLNKLKWNCYGAIVRRNALRLTIIMLQDLYKKACNQAKKMVDKQEQGFVKFVKKGDWYIEIRWDAMHLNYSNDAMLRISFIQKTLWVIQQNRGFTSLNPLAQSMTYCKDVKPCRDSIRRLFLITTVKDACISMPIMPLNRGLGI